MIFDISQPVFGCSVFPGHAVPQKITVCDIEKDSPFNLTNFSMSAHNGTHVDAPFHFIRDGKRIDEVVMEKFIGLAYVAEHTGNVTAEDVRRMLAKAEAANPKAAKKLLIKGDATVTEEAARAFAEAGMELVGNESQSVGSSNAPWAEHLILLAAEVVLLEGIRLAAVPEGVYLLHCAPLNLEGCDGAPCRATLMSL